MNSLQYFFLLFLTFVSFDSSTSQPHTTLIAPITKDSKTSLYTIPLKYQKEGVFPPNYTEPYVIDLDAPLLWRNRCPRPRNEVSCASHLCSVVKPYLSSLCPTPGNNASEKNCVCITTVVNPVAGECDLALLATYLVIMPQTNGRNPTGNSRVYQLYVSCASLNLPDDLPGFGVAGLSRAPLSLPSLFSSAKKFALCLPSTNKAKGVVFFGDGPYYLNSTAGNPDLRKVLHYTPLLKHPTLPEYFIGLKGMSINGRKVDFQINAFDMNSSGNGGVKISTIVPYTKLRSDIYKLFVEKFSEASIGIPRAKEVGRFKFCIDTKKVRKDIIGLQVPRIDLVLANGEHWPIFGANSMKVVGNNVACLAFVDGGKSAEHAVVIGTYQLENNLLLFDLAASRMGFSASLLLHKTICGNFDFTTRAA